MADFPPSSASGLLYKHYDVLPHDWAAVTDSFEFEDGGKTFNLRTSNPPQRWKLQNGPLSTTQAGYFDTFYDTYGIHLPFTFLDKNGTTQTNVRIESYSRSHPDTRAWRKTVEIVLVKYS